MNFCDKIIAWDDLPAWRKTFRATGKKLVVTNGCFDILHLGHVTYLENARNFGDALLIGVNSDKAVSGLKGPGRPVNSETDRQSVLAALHSVDGVCIFTDTTATKFLAAAQPDIYVKGGDYTLETLNQDERRAVESAGGKIVLVPFVPGKSTTGLLEKDFAVVKKILVISLAGIGDTLIATPFIRELRENYPDAVIDALVMWPGAKDLLEHNPNVNRVFQKNLMKCGRFEAVRFLLSLRRERYQLSVNTHPQSRIHYRVAAWLAGAQVRISHRYECSNWLDNWLVTGSLPQDYNRHSIENNFDVLPLIGAQKKLPAHEMDFFLEPGDERAADDFLTKHKLFGKKILGIHVGSGGTKNLPLKRWPLKNHAGLVRQLNKQRPDIHVLLFGGPEEAKDHGIVLAQANADLTREAKTKNLRETAALMKRCSAFLSVDTALMHIAAAVKVPNQIVIEAPTLNVTNWPYGNQFTLLKNPVVNGRNLDYYRYDGGDIKGTREELIAAMESVKVADVFATVTKLI